MDSKGTWRQGFICLRPPIPSPFPCYKLYENMLLYLLTQKRGGGEPVRRLEGRQFRRGAKNTNMIDSISSLQTLLNTSKDDI